MIGLFVDSVYAIPLSVTSDANHTRIPNSRNSWKPSRRDRSRKSATT